MRRCREACQQHRTWNAFLQLLLWSWVALLPLLEAHAVVPAISSEAFQAQITAMQQVAAACDRQADGCDAKRVPPRETVSGVSAGTFQVGWEWMAEALSTARNDKAAVRQSTMLAVSQHLAVLQQQTTASSNAPSREFPKARLAANTALARREFRTVTGGPAWWQRHLARAQDALLGLLFGMGRLGQRAPWLAPAIEWSCFGLAAAGLLWYVRRSLTRQALHISLSEGAMLSGRSAKGAEDWARRAEERAAAEDWREAIHCLYWAAIALLESRRAWRPNTTRTPREYLALLRPGSQGRQALGDLTRSFERIWYGHGQVDATQYRQALGSYHVLEACKPDRAAATGDPGGTAALPAVGEA